MRDEFEEELESLINRHSKENGPGTPDFILSKYLINCLTSLTIAIKQRDNWYNKDGIIANLESEIEQLQGYCSTQGEWSSKHPQDFVDWWNKTKNSI